MSHQFKIKRTKREFCNSLVVNFFKFITILEHKKKIHKKTELKEVYNLIWRIE